MSLQANEKQQLHRCQRIGCNAMFSPDDNAEGGCCYHPGPPLFHDGGKEWKCCKQRSHDFSLFLDIPGCTTGFHTTEKPQTSFTSSKKPIVTPVERLSNNGSNLLCSRCSQGFFCSEHGAQPAANSIQNLERKEDDFEGKSKQMEEQRVVDLNAEQSCKNCKKKYTEKENHDEACNYHPGPPVFHDRSRGWACCNVHVKEFEEFLTILPCTKGWHKGET